MTTASTRQAAMRETGMAGSTRSVRAGRSTTSVKAARQPTIMTQAGPGPRLSAKTMFEARNTADTAATTVRDVIVVTRLPLRAISDAPVDVALMSA